MSATVWTPSAGAEVSTGGTVTEVLTAITAGQTDFNFTRTFTVGGGNISIYVGGHHYTYGENYTELSNRSIRLTTGVSIGTEVIGVIGVEAVIVNSGQLVVESVVDNFAQLRALNKNVDFASTVLGGASVGDGAAGQFYLDQTDLTSAEIYGMLFVATDGGRWKRNNFNLVNVEWFGVKATSSDNTSAMALAIAYAKTHSKNLLIAGDYQLSSAVFDGFNGLTIVGAGNLIGKTTGSYEAVLVIKNSADITVIGRLGVVASWNSGYTSAVAVYTDNATQAATMTLTGIFPIGARLGWKFGRLTEKDALISEITVSGGALYGCPSAVEAIGTQTIISIVGTQLITGVNGGGAGWSSLPRHCVKAIGASISIIGGETLMTDVTNGALAVLQPINSSLYGHSYGSINIIGSHVESASQYGLIQNPDAIPSIVADFGQLSFNGCKGYHSQNAFAMINVASDFSGSINVANCDFYAGVSRSQPNVLCSGTGTKVYVDDISFGKNFVQGLNGISGGIAKFSRRLVFQASNANSQALSVGVPTTVKWQNTLNNQDTGRFNAAYSSSTGQLTIPAGGVRSAEVSICIRTSAPTQPLEVYIYINGAFAKAFMTMIGGASNNGILTGNSSLGNLAAGTTVEIVAVQGGLNSTINFGQYETFSLTALS
jgi:hypothetical protein